jgi:hypothetical protein
MAFAGSTFDSLCTVYTVYKKGASGQYRALHGGVCFNIDLVPCSIILNSTAAFSQSGGDLSVRSHEGSGKKDKSLLGVRDGARYFTGNRVLLDVHNSF